MSFFLIAVSLQPTAKAKHDDGASPILVVPGQVVLAKDAQQAAMRAMALVPADYQNAADRLEVGILPFPAANGLK